MVNKHKTIKDIRREVNEGYDKKRKMNYELSKLEGREKIMHEIGLTESRIKNVKYDIENMGLTEALSVKFKALENNLKTLNLELSKLNTEVIKA